jgi:hypothetical protein
MEKHGKNEISILSVTADPLTEAGGDIVADLLAKWIYDDYKSKQVIEGECNGKTPERNPANE